MPKVSRSALVSYSAESMFNLVNDVASYPQFLPGCAETKVHEESDESMHASMLIKKAGITQWLTTVNNLEQGRSIMMNLKDGPFKELTGGWSFTPLSDEACKIELNLDFSFSNKLIELAFGKAFSSIANNMVVAFTARAKVVYA